MLILGTHLNTSKALVLSLQALFGVNSNTALKLCSALGLNPKTKINHLNAHQLDLLAKVCREEIDTSLARQKIDNIKFLIHLKNYRGLRHMFGLPSRGQRTRTNASTSRKIMNKLRSNLSGNDKRTKKSSLSKKRK